MNSGSALLLLLHLSEFPLPHNFFINLGLIKGKEVEVVGKKLDKRPKKKSRSKKKKLKQKKSNTGKKSTFCETRLANMLRRLGVEFKQNVHIYGKEVDFLVKRPEKKDLIIEADGDIYHMDAEKRQLRDEHLKKAGFDIIHIWGSELLDAPEIPYNRLAKLFKISNPKSILRKKKKKKPGKKIQVSKSPSSPRKKEYNI